MALVATFVPNEYKLLDECAVYFDLDPDVLRRFLPLLFSSLLSFCNLLLLLLCDHHDYMKR